MLELNNSHPKVVGSIDFSKDLDIQDIRGEREKMIYQGSIGFARELGGSWTGQCLNILKDKLDEQDYKDLRIDTRVHMLKPGWFPCIPGWHTDFIRRSEDGDLQFQPEQDKDVRHFALCSHQPTTIFLRNRNIELEDENWGDISRDIETRIQKRFLNPFQVDPGNLIEFNSLELHKGTKCEQAGWRYFFRATLFPEGDERRGEYANKRRWQTQVYSPEHKGW